MTTRLISAATAVMAFALLFAGNAWAQVSENDPCSGLTGKAKGLCTAHSMGMGCSNDLPDATDAACGKVATLFEEVTGFPPPDDCTCDLSLDRIKGADNGWDFSQTYTCSRLAGFDSTTQTGTDDIDLRSTTPFSGNAHIGIVSTDIGVPKVSFQCGYAGTTSGMGEVNDLRFKPLTAEDIAALRKQYDACEGAIAILARNVTVVATGKNDCNF